MKLLRGITALALSALLAGAGCSGLSGISGISGIVRGASASSTPPASIASEPADPLELAGIEQPTAYAYLQLNAEDQEKYRIVLDAFQSREPRSYPVSDMDDLERIRDCVLSDHPELFYVSTVHMETTTNALTGQVTDIQIEGRYAYTPEETAEILAQADLAATECFAALPSDADDYAKSRRAYEFVASRVSYDHQAAGERGVIGNARIPDADDEPSPAPDQNIDGALVRGSAVCGGYASAYQYLLQRAGIQCAYVSGAANGESHAWCLALLDGERYFTDPTWGDLQYYDAESLATIEPDALSYDYLNVTTADLEKNHVIECPYPIDACTATADNYYVREGLMFDWPDEARLGDIVSANISEGRATQVRCADEDTFYSLYDESVTSGQLANFLPVNQYHYSCSFELLTISVW